MSIGAFFTGVGVGMALTVGLLTISGDRTQLYKQGQVDALSGNVKFHLVESSDGSRKWERKE